MGEHGGVHLEHPVLSLDDVQAFDGLVLGHSCCTLLAVFGLGDSVAGRSVNRFALAFDVLLVACRRDVVSVAGLRLFNRFALVLSVSLSGRPRGPDSEALSGTLMTLFGSGGGGLALLAGLGGDGKVTVFAIICLVAAVTVVVLVLLAKGQLVFGVGGVIVDGCGDDDGTVGVGGAGVGSAGVRAVLLNRSVADVGVVVFGCAVASVGRSSESGRRDVNGATGGCGGVAARDVNRLALSFV